MSTGQRFTDLHREGAFLLVNVHDPGTAAIAEHAGAVALGTTSAGHAYSLGRSDGVGAVTKGEAVERAAKICGAVNIPVSVDAENGWGHRPEEVAATIRELAAIGAAGASIEDWSGDAQLGIYDHALAVDRITAAVEAARSLPDPFVVCARAEGLLYDAGYPMATAIGRLQAFAQAGADCLYAPGLRTRADVEYVVVDAGGPVNALCSIGGQLSVAEAIAAGARRISLGGSLYRATMATFSAMVTSLVTTGGTQPPHAPLTDSEMTAIIGG